MSPARPRRAWLIHVSVTFLSLSVIACGGGDAEPVVGAALPGTVSNDSISLQSAAVEARCPLEVDGMAVTYADTPVATDILDAALGPCTLARAAHDSAHGAAQTTFVEGYRAIAQDTADSFGEGDHEAASQRLRHLVRNGDLDAGQVGAVLTALSGCVTEAARDRMATSIVTSATAEIHSVGTFVQGGHICEGVLWA